MVSSNKPNTKKCIKFRPLGAFDVSLKLHSAKPALTVFYFQGQLWEDSRATSLPYTIQSLLNTVGEAWGPHSASFRQLVKLFLQPADAFYFIILRALLVARTVKSPSAMQDIWVQFLGQEDPLEEGMATYSSILAWRIPWTEEPDGLQSLGSQRVGHDWATDTTTTVQFQNLIKLCNPAN